MIKVFNEAHLNFIMYIWIKAIWFYKSAPDLILFS